MTGNPAGDGDEDRAARRAGRDHRGRWLRSVDSAQRDAQAATLKAAGCTWQEIADRLGYSDRGTACRAVSRLYAETVTDTAEQARALEADRLDALTRAYWPLAMTPPPLRHRGRLVLDEHGQPVPDYRAHAGAGQLVLRIMDRRAKLLGLDAPTRTVTEIDSDVTAEIERLAAQLGAGNPAPVDKPDQDVDEPPES